MQAADQAFWQKLNPSLSIDDTPFPADLEDFSIRDTEISNHVQQMLQEGYFKTDAIVPKPEATKLALAVQSVVNCGLPPVFVFVYNEFWQLFSRLSGLITPILGDEYYLMPADIWAWFIRPGSNVWAPHRDIVTPESVFHADGRPTKTTVWIPLTDVTPLNSCMYVLPTHLDPNLPDNPFNISLRIQDLQNIRALPAAAGSVLAWNPRILHWGANCTRLAKVPRISVAIYMQSKDINSDYHSGFPDTSLQLSANSELGFEQRLDAIRAAIRQYRGRVRNDYPDIADSLMKFALLDEHPELPALPKRGPQDVCYCGSGKAYAQCHGADSP